MGDRERLHFQSLNGLPFPDGDIISLPCTNVNLPWAPNLYATFLEHHLPPVGQPAHHTWYSKENGEEVERKTLSSMNAQQQFPPTLGDLPIAR